MVFPVLFLCSKISLMHKYEAQSMTITLSMLINNEYDPAVFVSTLDEWRLKWSKPTPKAYRQLQTQSICKFEWKNFQPKPADVSKYWFSVNLKTFSILPLRWQSPHGWLQCSPLLYTLRFLTFPIKYCYEYLIKNIDIFYEIKIQHLLR